MPPNAKRQKLADVCRTRWLERMEGISIFDELFASIFNFTREMKENKCETHFNKETSAKADSLFKLVIDFSFISTLVIIRNTLD